MTSIYLSRPMQYAEQNDEEWITRLREEYGDRFDFLDPKDEGDLTGDAIVWPHPDEPNPTISAQEIVWRDKQLINEANMILIALQDTIEVDGETAPVPTYGVQREHEYAACQCGMPAVLWYTDDIDRLPVWAMADTDFLSTDLESCMGFANDYHEATTAQEFLTG